MYKFGKKSQKQLMTCHEDIQAILFEVIRTYDFSVLEGIRTAERQQFLFADGKTTLDGINKKSKHQDRGDGVSYAVDIMPYKKGTNAFSGKDKDKKRFYFLMGIVKGVADMLLDRGTITHKVRFGLDWDGDHRFDDQSFDDLPHFELIKA